MKICNYIMQLINQRYLQILIEVWLSLVERCVRDAEAAGSSPVTSTKEDGFLTVFFFFEMLQYFLKLSIGKMIEYYEKSS